MRAVVVVLVMSLSCSPRARMVSGVAVVGAVGVGAPLAHECTPDGPDDCGAARYAMFMATGAAPSPRDDAETVLTPSHAEDGATDALTTCPDRAVRALPFTLAVAGRTDQRPAVCPDHAS